MKALWTGGGFPGGTRVTRIDEAPGGGRTDALTVLGEERLVRRRHQDNIKIARAGRAGSRVKRIDFGLAKGVIENGASQRGKCGRGCFTRRSGYSTRNTEGRCA